ncbi:MAG: hypothetical protein ACI81P_001566, partial [Neolewinella sp.]
GGFVAVAIQLITHSLYSLIYFLGAAAGAIRRIEEAG